MEDDDDVLLQNDPLALYLKSLQCNDFETATSNTQYTFHDIIPGLNTETIITHPIEELQTYFENILKSELLLIEDYDILEAYYSNKLPTQDKLLYKISLSSTVSLLGGLLFKYSNYKIIKILSPVCCVPLVFNIYDYIKRKLKNRNIEVLLQSLNNLTRIVKKCLQLIREYSASIGYYSSGSINVSTINAIHIQFAKQLCAKIINIIKLLALNSTEIIFLVPLIIENNLKYSMKDDLFLKDNVNIADLKLLFELYLLVQSDFIKTLGLACCSNLWLCANCNIDKVITEYIPSLIILLNKDEQDLKREYNVLRNYGINTKHTEMRSPRKFKNGPTNYITSCLHNAEIHFQQLLCKTRDLQIIMEEAETEENKNKMIVTLLNELDKQMISSKEMIEAVTKYFNQLQNKIDEPEIKVTMPQPTATVRTVENQEEEFLKQEKLTYELYIPKEGLSLDELEIDTQRPVFSMQDLDYSGILLQELRTILKVRNPEVFEENTRKPDVVSESESEEELYNSYKQKHVFRPVQPVGLAENLQTIDFVLAARRNLLQCEEICGDTSDVEDDDI